LSTEEICDKCGEVLSPQTRVISEKVDKKSGDMKKAIICFDCFKRKALNQMKLLTLAGIIAIGLGLMTILLADQLVYYSGFPELGGLYTSPQFYWGGGGGISIIGTIVAFIGNRRYKKVQSWKSKADLL
jgi:hypothetical protein